MYPPQQHPGPVVPAGGGGEPPGVGGAAPAGTAGAAAPVRHAGQPALDAAGMYYYVYWLFTDNNTIYTV